MLSRAISLSRLRSYAEICRQHAAGEQSDWLRDELSKFADSFHRAAEELKYVRGEAALNASARSDVP